MHQLQHSWEQLLQPFGIEQVKAQATFIALVDAYNSPGRVYHTLDHVQDILGWIERLRSYATDLPAILLAAWFHDSIYDPYADDNEEQSAIYAQNVLSGSGIPSETLQAVSQMILSTKTHQAQKDDNDCQILLDADLAILGASATRYNAYAKAIRQEYSRFPEMSYKPGRAQVLEAFLQQDKLYWTVPMQTALEAQARANIQRELDVLLPG